MQCDAILLIPVETWGKKCKPLFENDILSKAGNKSRDVSSGLLATSVDGC